MTAYMLSHFEMKAVEDFEQQKKIDKINSGK